MTPCAPLSNPDEVLVWFPHPAVLRAERVDGHVVVYYDSEDEQALDWLIATKEYAWQTGLHELNIRFEKESV